MIEHALHCGTPFGVAVAGCALLRRVGAQQFVAQCSARGLFGEQVLIAQLRQRQVRLASRHARQAGRRRNRDIWPRVHSKQPEHPLRGLAFSLARDQENTIRTLVAGSPVSKASSRPRASRISAASAASD